MRVLITSYDYRPNLGGVATSAYNLAKVFDSYNDISVKILAPRMKEDISFDQVSNISISRCLMPKKAIFSIPFFVFYLYKEIKKFKPDIIINMLWMPSGVACYFLKNWLFRKNIKYCVYAHGVEILESKYTLKKRIRHFLSPLKQKVFASANFVFSVSHFTAGILTEQMKIDKNKIEVVFNGVDINYFIKKNVDSELKNQFSIKDEKIFITITRLDDYKGVDFAIKAFAKIRNENFKYLIGGVGYDLQRLRELIQHFNLEDKIILCGKIKESQLVDFYNLADVNVLLSRYDYKAPNVEGFGLVFLEAASCNVTSLAGNSGGIPDAVINHKTGILVGPEDTDEIAVNLKKFIHDDKMLHRLSANAYNWSRLEMTWEKVAERILKRIKEY